MGGNRSRLCNEEKKPAPKGLSGLVAIEEETATAKVLEIYEECFVRDPKRRIRGAWMERLAGEELPFPGTTVNTPDAAEIE